MAQNHHSSKIVRRTAVRIDISCQNLFSPRQQAPGKNESRQRNMKEFASGLESSHRALQSAYNMSS